MSLPQHVAIVMDGNGRWAEARGEPRTAGHKAGLEPVRMTGMTYNPISRQYRLVDGDLSVNYLVAFRKP